METSFLWFGVFSGSFGVLSIVLCKCSGKVAYLLDKKKKKKKKKNKKKKKKKKKRLEG